MKREAEMLVSEGEEFSKRVLSSLVRGVREEGQKGIRKRRTEGRSTHAEQPFLEQLTFMHAGRG